MNSEFIPSNPSYTKMADTSAFIDGKQKYAFKVQKPGEEFKNSDFQNSSQSKKKPGRKQDNTKPISKRIQQNRIAQRAFRERRETYIKNLESKVKDLEEAQLKTKIENERLMDYLKSIDQKNTNSISSINNLANQATTNSNNLAENNSSSFAHSCTEQHNNYITSSESFPVTSTGFGSISSTIPQSANKPIFTDHNAYTPYSDAIVTDPNTQNNFSYSEQQPQTSLVNDYMFPDAGAISSSFSYEATVPDNMYLNITDASHAPSYTSQSSIPFNSYVAQDYYPAPVSATPRMADCALPALIPSNNIVSENETTLSSPILDPLEIMNPNRLPPTPQEIYKLAIHHKMMTEKMSKATFTIDELCEAMRKKATCSAVHDYLTSYLGQDPLKLV